MPSTPTDRTGLATVVLVALTAVWGSTFFLIRDLVRTVPSADFLGIRFSIAAIIMATVFWRQVAALNRTDLRRGLVVGGMYGGAQLLQTVGLEHTSASVSGFITGMYVVLTPVFSALLLRERISGPAWAAVALATAGLALLSLNGLSIGRGELLTLGCAAMYAVQIMLLGRWSVPEKVIGLSCVQVFVIAVCCDVAALSDGLTLPSGVGQWSALLYMAIVAGIGALLGQTWAQAHLSATRAAIVMTLEPVFAAGFAVAFGGESLTARMVIGGALVVAAMYLVELRGGASPTTHPPGGSGPEILPDPAART